MAFFEDVVERRGKQGESTLNAWRAVFRHVTDFTGGQCTFADVTKALASDFRAYLLSCAPRSLKSKDAKAKKLSPNTAKMYFDRFGSVVREAREKNFIIGDPLAGIEPIKTTTPKRDFLSLDELRLLAQTSCDIPDTFRRGILFSAMTGLRYSDVRGLTWANVGRNSTVGFYLDFKIQKTGEQAFLPISRETCEFLGQKGGDNEKVFPGLVYESALYNLEKWTKAAGLRRVTFHALRRTYATAQITLGTDIYTVSKLLGQSNTKQTQIYAHLVDEKKREAANKISLK